MSTITTVNPATEQELETYSVMTEAEATERLEACHAAFLEWRKTDHSERAKVLKAIVQGRPDRGQDLRGDHGLHRSEWAGRAGR